MDIFLRTSGVVARYHYVTYLIIALILFSGSTTVRANQPQLIESNGFQYSIAPAAEWVRDSQYGMSDSQSPETVRYLLVDQQVMFRNGDATVYNRNVEQPLTTEGVAQSSRIEVSFNPVYQKLVWHNVTVKRGAKEMNRLSSSTITLLQREESLDQADYDAVFYPGGHGPLWDLTDNGDSITLIEAFLNANKPVGAVCHATAALLNIKDNAGQYVVKDKVIAGFSNSEEDAVQLTDIVPFLLEDELIKRGAEYQKGADWVPFAVQDGLLITGQNPASSELVADKLIKQMSA